MEPIGRSFMGSNTNTTMATTTSATSAVVGHLMSPTRSAVDSVARNTKTSGLGHNDNHRVPLQHCVNDSNVVQHHQYHSPILVASTLPPPPPAMLIHPTRTSSLLPTSSQLMLSTTTATAAGVIPHFQQHNSRSHQLITSATVPVSTTSEVMPTSNITVGGGMALSPFGILPHERVVPQQQTHHRHQHRKLPTCSQSSKILMDTSSAQTLTTPVINSQRFYVEPTHFSNKMKQYDSIQQQQQHNQRFKIINDISDKNLPLVPSAYTSQSYEQRYQPRTASQQVGYLSVITRTAVTTANNCMMDDIPANNNYYPAQTIPLQSKTSDNHERQYYHFDSTASASQTPQQHIDNILLMGNPVQRGDPMHIVKNLQSMQTDIDCYGVKKMIEQPRLLPTDHSKVHSSASLLSNGNKCMTDQNQLPKSTVINSSSTYNGQYFNRRQPPPAHLQQNNHQTHLQQYMVTGNTKMLPTPTSLTVISANGNTYFDVHQHQRHRWNLDQQRPPMISTPSCFSGNVSTGVCHQPSINHDQQFNNVVSTFNIPSSVSNILHYQHSAHHNNPTYYNPTTSTNVSPIVTSVTTSNHSLSLYNRQNQNIQPSHPNGFNDFANNLQDVNYVGNDNNKSSSNVIVPNIEQELSHLCDDSATTNIIVKPLNVINQQPSFIDSYIKFIHGGANTNIKTDDKLNEKPKKLLRSIASSTPKPISKKYIPLPKSKIVTTSASIPTNNVSNDSIRAHSNVTIPTDDDPRYFPLPKTSSSIADISDCSNADNSWLSADDEQDNWWTIPSKNSSTLTSVIKNKTDVPSKKKNNATKKNTSINKKQKKQHQYQPRRQLSHRLAKEKSQKLLTSVNGDLDIDDDSISDPDSDIDPAWKPNSDDKDSTKNSSLMSNRRHFNHKKYSKEMYLKNCHLPSSTSSINNNVNDILDESTLIPFKSGTFVALKSQFLDNGQVTPEQLWRVDGKSLLQKFQKCNDNNIYKSVSTYTGWSQSHYNMYCQVSVKLVTNYNGMDIIPNKFPNEMIVQLCDSNSINKLPQNDSVVNDKIYPSNYNNITKPKDDILNSIHSTIDNQSISLRANFDVFVQSLISQALDSNFLEEIYREKDEFFLSNIQAIETVTQTWVQAINSVLQRYSETDLSRIENVRTIITRYPILEICPIEEHSINIIQLCCVVCGLQETTKQKFVEICFSGAEYNLQTFKNIEVDKTFSKILPIKQIYCCSNSQCVDMLTIWHNIVHLKYHIYKECCRRISTENISSNGLNQDKTSVLNRLLADDEWIEKLFQIVCNTWLRAKKFVSSSLSNYKVST